MAAEAPAAAPSTIETPAAGAPTAAYDETAAPASEVEGRASAPDGGAKYTVEWYLEDIGDPLNPTHANDRGRALWNRRHHGICHGRG